MQQLMAAPNSPRARTMYLIGWMLGGRIGDVSLASEFPVSQLYAPLGNVPMQLNLMQASGEDLDQAEKRLMQMINTDRTHDWSWLRGMRSFVDHQNRARVEGTVQAVYQPAPGRGCPQEGPCLHPIPMHWVRNQLTPSETGEHGPQEPLAPESIRKRRARGRRGVVLRCTR